MAERIERALPPDLLSNYQIIHSRVRELDDTKKKVYVLHDLPGDPEVSHLRNCGWQKFDKLVFVSHWQQQMYNVYLGVPYSAGIVLQNAVYPFTRKAKPTDKVRLMYFSTPHRGLSLLYPVYDKLYREFGDQIELNVFSSFDLYGWEARDKEFEPLFEKLKAHPGINYSKSVPNVVIREELHRSHILAYPSIWQETSCLVLIESMCAGLTCVHSSLAALPETAMGCTYMYQYTQNNSMHEAVFEMRLRNAIVDTLDGYEVADERLEFINETYGWHNRMYEWEDLLTSLL